MIIYELQLPLPELHPESVFLITADLEEGASYPKNGIRRVIKTILHVYMGNVQHRPQGVQTCTGQQESGTLLLLSSANKLIFA